MASQEIDVINFVMNQGNGVKALSDLSLGTVPANYILPVEQRLGELNTKSKTDSDCVIPIIDVSNWEDSPIIEGLICDAARKLGFFQIINHGIPMEVFDKVLEASHRFFALPVEERKEYFFRSNDSGDTCHLKTSFMSHKEKVLEWKDFLLHQICSSQNSKEVKEGKDLPKGFSRWPPISRYLLKSSIISALSKQALKPNGASDLSALQQLLVDQPNIPKEEVQFLFDIIFAEEIC